jgi:hypothetical protein
MIVTSSGFSLTDQSVVQTSQRFIELTSTSTRLETDWAAAYPFPATGGLKNRPVGRLYQSRSLMASITGAQYKGITAEPVCWDTPTPLALPL